MKFTIGSILIVRPEDSDDPEANAMEGRRCRLLRYQDTSAGGEIAFVQFSTQGRAIAFRPDDLELAVETELEATS